MSGHERSGGTRRARRLSALLMAGALSLTSCRTWHRYEAIPPQDMVAAAALFMQQHHPGAPAAAQGEEADFAFSEAASWWSIVMGLVFTAGLVLPIRSSYAVAVRPAEGGGSELCVESFSQVQLCYLLPVWFHDEHEERKAREGILAQAEWRAEVRGAAERTARAFAAAVRAQDLAAFSELVWPGDQDPERLTACLSDPTGWAPERAGEAREVHVSWPPRTLQLASAERDWVGRRTIGTCHVVEASLRVGLAQRRYRVVRHGSRSYVWLATGPGGALLPPE